MPHLQIRQGDRCLLTHRLTGPALRLGRSDRCDIALPAEELSREHCRLERRGGGWWVVDQSTHGITLDGKKVREAPIAPGQRLGLGPYELVLQRDLGQDAGAVTRQVTWASYEELVDVEDGVASTQVVLRLCSGPREGELLKLTRSRCWLGGPGADILLAPDLPRDAVGLRVVRGRLMVDPGTRPCTLSGVRVRELTPALHGEELRVGKHTMVVEIRVVKDRRATRRLGTLVGTSHGMQRMLGVLERVARHDAPLLILGESGTGKELVSRTVHEQSPRAAGPLISINCASLPANLVESELFGHEEGAFTGATARREGAFQRADGGTLFLDEIGEMSLDAQAKLLRVLETGEVLRVGGHEPEYPDVRVIAATHRHLGQMVAERTFREDLLFRLGVLHVQVPALRERLEDLPELVHSLLEQLQPGARIDDDALELLSQHHWPGNVRELRNVLLRALVMGGSPIGEHDLRFNPWGTDTPQAEVTGPAGERSRLERILRKHQGNKAAAARELGIPRTSLLYKMRKYGIRG